MLKKTLLSLAGLLLGLTVAELLLRGLAPVHFADNFATYCYDPETAYRLKSSLELREITDYQQEYFTNRLGTLNYQENFRDYRILIFALGDSFTQGVGVPGDAGYPFQLDLLLNLKGNGYRPDYAVVNLGVAGYGGEQSLRRLKEYRKMIGNPRYLLFLGNETDYADDQEFRSGKLHRKLVAGNSNFHPWALRLRQWFNFESEAGKRINLLRRSLNQSRNPGGPPSQDPPVSYAELQEPFWRKLGEAAEEMNATLIIGWVPVLWSLEPDKDYGWLKQFAAQNHLAFADWLPEVRSVMRSLPKLPAVNHHSAGHYRTWVNGAIARAYAKHIH
jgi:hypothetical protein